MSSAAWIACETCPEEEQWDANFQKLSRTQAELPDLIEKPFSVSTCTFIFKPSPGDGATKRQVNIGALRACVEAADADLADLARAFLSRPAQPTVKPPRKPRAYTKGPKNKPRKRQEEESDADSDRDDDDHDQGGGDAAGAVAPPPAAAPPAEDFMNQLTLVFPGGASKCSVKVFNNLVLHVTGCKSPTEARGVASIAWHIAQKVAPAAAGATYTLRLAMVNITSELSISLNLGKTTAGLRPHSRVHYDKVENRYPGATAKFCLPIVLTGAAAPAPAAPRQPLTELRAPPEATASAHKQTTIMMFASGSLVFSSSSLASIAATHAFFLAYVREQKDNIQNRLAVPSRKKRASMAQEQRAQKRTAEQQQQQQQAAAALEDEDDGPTRKRSRSRAAVSATTEGDVAGGTSGEDAAPRGKRRAPEAPSTSDDKENAAPHLLH